MSEEITLQERQQIDLLKHVAFEARHDAEKAMYEYFCACPVGPERERASDIYENIRNATRTG